MPAPEQVLDSLRTCAAHLKREGAAAHPRRDRQAHVHVHLGQRREEKEEQGCGAPLIAQRGPLQETQPEDSRHRQAATATQTRTQPG